VFLAHKASLSRGICNDMLLLDTNKVQMASVSSANIPGVIEREEEGAADSQEKIH